MIDNCTKQSAPQNERIKQYRRGSTDRQALENSLDSMISEQTDVTSVIDGHRVETGEIRKVTLPHDKNHVLANCHVASEKQLLAAVQSARRAKSDWAAAHWEERAAIFLRAAELLAGPYRSSMNAATMLGQSKNVHEAEIDSACELIDFLRFNVYFYERLLKQQPQSVPGIRNTSDYRPLDGFVLALTPFNFTAIAGNLPTAPALLGNTIVWKPADTQVTAAYLTMSLLEAAGMPPGVINMVTASGPSTSDVLLAQNDLAGVHFTGSTATFDFLCRQIGANISSYDSYPRIIGETGGKDFVFAHPSADVAALSVALIRGAFEYQGQKCSAASRAYIPSSLWPDLRELLVEHTRSIRVGDVRDFGNLANAVIDEHAFARIESYLSHAASHPHADVLVGGKTDSARGYFIDPTIIVANDPNYRSMREEIFGPVLTVFVYDDKRIDEALSLCDSSTPYALTGAVFGQDRRSVANIARRLRFSAGNLYINDKPTGAVVGQQPFGGSRKSGTNDKSGSPLNLLRWCSPRTIKENFSPPKSLSYAFME